LALLEKFGLIDEALENGRRIDTVAFYENAHCRAEVRLSEIRAAFPFLVVVPQHWIEDALEHALRQAGVAVRWEHRLQNFSQTPEGAEVSIEKLGGSGFGYSVPHWESLVEKRFPIIAQFVIGADGPNSTVRRAAGLEFEIFGPFQHFVVYEFETDEQCVEARVVMRPHSTDVLWPLPGDLARWTFQLSPPDNWGDFPEKEREHVYVNEDKIEDRICDYARQIAHDRAPWFTGGIKEVLWRTPVQFQPRIVKQLGHERCWLVGDAAHQALPFAMQSMNAGLQESKCLTDALQKITRENGSLALLRDYSAQTRKAWVDLLSPEAIHLRRSTNQWVRQHGSRIVSCLPALGQDLQVAADQLKLSVRRSSRAELQPGR
jgi:2-polyprenyl-6-methoxyphenol hydroxylase-like FAD-dependent oxidoreductase